MIKYYDKMEQGTTEWVSARCGLITASNMKKLLTQKLKLCANETERSYLNELLAERVTRHVEPNYVSYDMQRGKDDEIIARQIYADTFAEVQQCGFITNDNLGFILGYSPDGLVGYEGLIEIKSRNPALQMATLTKKEIPEEFVLQIQAGLLISGRLWCDFVSYSNGMSMAVIRCYPDAEIQTAIVYAATQAEVHLTQMMEAYKAKSNTCRTIPTMRRRNEGEIII